MRVVVFGGTGYIGSEVCKKLLSVSEKVVSVSRGVRKGQNCDVEYLYANLVNLSKDDIVSLLKDYNFDTAVYAMGPDLREETNTDSYTFFKQNLIYTSIKVIEALTELKVKNIAYCTSYFLYFDAKFPKKKLSILHPYIKAVKESVEAIKHIVSKKDYQVNLSILGLCYIFGVSDSMHTIYKDLFLDKYALKRNRIFFVKGGSVMCTLSYATDAIVSSLSKTEGIQTYFIGDENRDYAYMFDNLMIGFDKRVKKIFNLNPLFAGFISTVFRKFNSKTKDVHLSVDLFRYIIDVQSDFFYFPENEIIETTEKLSLKRGFLKDAMIDEGKYFKAKE